MSILHIAEKSQAYQSLPPVNVTLVNAILKKTGKMLK